MSKGFGMNAAEVSPHGLPVPAGGDATRRRDLRAIPINAHLVTLLPVGRQPFRYAPERPTTGKVRVARQPPGTRKSRKPVTRPSIRPVPVSEYPAIRYRQLTRTSRGVLAVFSACARTRNRWPSLVTTNGAPPFGVELTVGTS